MKNVKMSLTKLGIAACNKMFPAGVRVEEMSDGTQVTVVTVLTHPDDPIDIHRKVAEQFPTKEWESRYMIWGVKLGYEPCPVLNEEGTILESIVSRMLELKSEHVPSNFIMAHSAIRSTQGDEVAVRNDYYYNWHLPAPQREEIKKALAEAYVTETLKQNLMLTDKALS
jgi:hypothetical protein